MKEKLSIKIRLISDGYVLDLNNDKVPMIIGLNKLKSFDAESIFSETFKI